MLPGTKPELSSPGWIPVGDGVTYDALIRFAKKKKGQALFHRNAGLGPPEGSREGVFGRVL